MNTQALDWIKKRLNTIATEEPSQLHRLADELREEWGLPADSDMVPFSTSTVSATVEPIEVTVCLVAAGPNKIDTIKLVRTVTTLGLVESKNFVDALPKPLAELVSPEEAKALAAKFEAIGAKVEIR